MNKSSKVSPPDAFSTAPLLSILPVRSQISRLEPLTSFFYARYEKVNAMRKELEGPGADSEALRRVIAEQGMIKGVLDWLEVTPTAEENK